MAQRDLVRIAAIYDIHGNLPALEAVLDDVRRVGVDEIIIGGDVLPGPMPEETLSSLTSLDIPARFIRGNGDRDALARIRGEPTDPVPERYREAVQWAAQQVRGYEAVLAGWPATLRTTVPPFGEILFCHATPRNDTELFTRLTDETRLRPVFDGLDADVVICGHTHMQFDRMVGQVRVINAGSAGMPFGEPGAYWLLIGSELELRRTSYDLASAAARIRATRYPQAEEFAAGSVRRHLRPRRPIR